MIFSQFLLLSVLDQSHMQSKFNFNVQFKTLLEYLIFITCVCVCFSVFVFLFFCQFEQHSLLNYVYTCSLVHFVHVCKHISIVCVFLILFFIHYLKLFSLKTTGRMILKLY